jgi:hypothetical protein
MEIHSRDLGIFISMMSAVRLTFTMALRAINLVVLSSWSKLKLLNLFFLFSTFFIVFLILRNIGLLTYEFKTYIKFPENRFFKDLLSAVKQFCFIFYLFMYYAKDFVIMYTAKNVEKILMLPSI